jgi:SRSO17 transposase
VRGRCKGPAVYDWALIGTASPRHHLLARRPVSGGELAFFTCNAPAGTPLSELVAAAGARWAIEECFYSHRRSKGAPALWTNFPDAEAA